MLRFAVDRVKNDQRYVVVITHVQQLSVICVVEMKLRLWSRHRHLSMSVKHSSDVIHCMPLVGWLSYWLLLNQKAVVYKIWNTVD